MREALSMFRSRLAQRVCSLYYQGLPHPMENSNMSVGNIFRRRVPLLYQMSMTECGAACLAMILTYYGRKTSVSEIRERCGVGRDGLSALAIVRAARSYGLRTRAITLKEVKDFRFVSLPAIIHWNFNHFLVIEYWSTSFVDVVDPALGRTRLPKEERSEEHTSELQSRSDLVC